MGLGSGGEDIGGGCHRGDDLGVDLLVDVGDQRLEADGCGDVVDLVGVRSTGDLGRASHRTGHGHQIDGVQERAIGGRDDLLGLGGKGRGVGDDRHDSGVDSEVAIGGHDRRARRLRGRSSREELGEQLVVLREQPGTGLEACLSLRLELVKASFQLGMHGGGENGAREKKLGKILNEFWKGGEKALMPRC